MIEKLEKLDRRWIFLAMFFMVLIPLLKPLGLPILPGSAARSFYEGIEKIPNGSRILISGDYDPASRAELQPMMLTLLDQCFRKDLRVVVMELWPGAPPLVQEAIDIKAQAYHKAYGVDYINLGFKDGQQAVMVGIGSAGFEAVYPSDNTGKPLRSFPIMRGVKNYKDFAALANISAGFPGTKEWVQQVGSRFNIPLCSGTTAVSAAEYVVYLQTGQLFGLLGGMAGAAEYEKLSGKPAMGTSGMDAMSFAHFTVVFFIVLGNVLGVLKTAQAKGGK